MEFATKSTAKPSPNVSEIVSKFAKSCKFRSIGVFPSENPGHDHHYQFSNNDVCKSASPAEEAESYWEKVHPQSVEIPTKTTECDDAEIGRLFEAISALKLAYVQLQGAHIPYDPEKIKAADELVVGRLEALCKIKRAYKEKQFREAIQVHESMLEKLKIQVKTKNSEIRTLIAELQDRELKNRKLVEELRQRERKNIEALKLYSTVDIYEAASKAIHDFTKPLISLMKASGWDLDQSADSIQPAVNYSKRSHKKYAFEAHVARRMFHGFPLQFDNVDRLLKPDDPMDALIRDPDSDFAKFCVTKYLQVVHPSMEESFFGNLDHRTFVSSGKHPRTPFYQAYVKMAKWVWVLQAIAASSEPKAEMFSVKRGSEFSDGYMESVEALEEDTAVSHEGRTNFKVEFMVVPGFRIGETFIKSRVYLSRVKS
ncbi:hypothetical protein NMG60_11014408 [Bertholletia excelsa]